MSYQSPVYNVIAVPIEKVKPNTYNPNKVAPPERRLLYESIKEDGYTMPVVCYYAKAQDLYLIVDGFHRYQVMLDHPDIYEREQGLLPVSVIDKPIDKRMASTIRHNRARGTHNVDLMSNIVKELNWGVQMHGSPNIWEWTGMRSCASNRSQGWPPCFGMSNLARPGVRWRTIRIGMMGDRFCGLCILYDS